MTGKPLLEHRLYHHEIAAVTFILSLFIKLGVSCNERLSIRDLLCGSGVIASGSP